MLLARIISSILLTVLVACGAGPAPTTSSTVRKVNDPGPTDADKRKLPDQGIPFPSPTSSDSVPAFKDCDQFASGFAFDQSMDSADATFSGTYSFIVSRTYQAWFQNRLDIAFKDSDVTESSTGDLKSADSSRAVDQATKDLAGKQQNMHAVRLSGVDRASLVQKDGVWGNIHCAVMALNTVTTGSNTGLTVQYDPALPSSIIPSAGVDVLAQEIGDGKSFSNLKAVVTSGSNSVLKNGATVAGSASIQPISPTMDYTDGNGDKITVKADKAFEISISFGDPKITRSLGLRPVTRYYLSAAKKNFVAVYVDWLDKSFMPATLYQSN